MDLEYMTYLAAEAVREPPKRAQMEVQLMFEGLMSAIMHMRRWRSVPSSQMMRSPFGCPEGMVVEMGWNELVWWRMIDVGRSEVSVLWKEGSERKVTKTW